MSKSIRAWKAAGRAVSMRLDEVGGSAAELSTKWREYQEAQRPTQLAAYERRATLDAQRRAARQRFRVAVLLVVARARFMANLNHVERTVAGWMPWLCPKPDERDLSSGELESPLLDGEEPSADDTEYDIDAKELKQLNENHSVDELQNRGGVAGIMRLIKTDEEAGLVDNDKELEKRRDVFGSNTYPEKETKGFWQFVWEASQDTTLIILLVAAIVSLGTGVWTEGWAEGWHDGVGIAFAILLVLFLNAGNNYNQALAFRDLNRKKKNIPIEVSRGGRRIEVSIHDLVVGDIVHIGVGDQIPADGLLISGHSMLVDESSMTGENEPVHKDKSQPFLLSGSKLSDGYGIMVVTAVGMNTEWGKIMASVSEDNDSETPLQERLRHTALAIGKVGLAVAILVFFILIVRYVITEKIDLKHYSLQQFLHNDLTNLVGFFAISVTIVVVAVPEGLPLAVTLSLAYSMRQMAKDNALVRHLESCETMGGATTICSDKTGTLTTNKMVVVRGWVAGVELSAKASSSELKQEVAAILHEAVCTNSDGSVYNTQEGVEITGKPTETAVLAFGLQLGADFKHERSQVEFVDVAPFSSEKKRMGVMVKNSEGQQRIHWKGAPDMLLKLANRAMQPDGSVQELTESTRKDIEALLDGMANESLRTIILTYADVDGDSAPTVHHDKDAANGEQNGDNTNNIPDKDLVVLAIVGIKDPCRQGVPEAVKECQAAGIMVRMCTGDYIVTAKAIARECNILTEDGIAIEGPKFRNMTDEERIKIIPKLQVMARSSPSDKHTLVNLLRTHFGEVVAVTGDGTNDAPALKEADIGLSMGIAGTEIAKEASDIIILDDNFATIVGVVRWGRSVFNNIRKFVQFQMTVNVVALLLNFITASVYGMTALTAVQLLWVNLVMDTLGALALATEPPTDKLMRRKPIRREESLFSPHMIRNMLVQIIYQLGILLAILYYGYTFFKLTPPPPDSGRKGGTVDWQDARILNTIVFNSFVFLQLFNEISSRDMESVNVFKGLFTNRIFLGVQATTVIVQIIMVELLNEFASTEPLTLYQWGVCVSVGLVGLVLAAVGKFIPVPTPKSQLHE
eukprot:jgi/Chlat1/690/Chrsp104S01168